MDIKKPLIFVLLIICIILVFILTDFLNLNQNPSHSIIRVVGNEENAISMAKDISEVKRFLTVYPDANISATYISCNGGVSLCPGRCFSIMGGSPSDYYVVEIRKGDLCLGVKILDKGASMGEVELTRNDPEHQFQKIYLSTNLIDSEKNCNNDSDCKCWFGCGCDIPPKRGCVCEKDEYYCLNYIYATENEINTCDEKIKCKCINNTCTLFEGG